MLSKDNRTKILLSTVIGGTLIYAYWKHKQSSCNCKEKINFKKSKRNKKAWDFYENKLGAPKHICAPMVLGSELPFRMLVRQHGADLCYSPMMRGNFFVFLAIHQQ